MLDNRNTGKDSWIRSVFVVLSVVLLVLGIATSPAGATALPASTPKITFEIDSSSWTAAEKATLQEWTNPTGLVQKTETEVVGAPAESMTVKIVKASAIEHAGEYEQITPEKGVMYLSKLELPIFNHEDGHAIHGPRILRDRTWEEGMARCAEKEEMRILATKGVVEAGYDVNHSYGYDVYYENDNVPAIGTGEEFGIYVGPMVLLRYEQAGYACSKIMIENPQFLKQFNAKLFTHPNGELTPTEIAAIVAEVQPTIEGQPAVKWIEGQYIFDTELKQDCYLDMRVNQYTVDEYCINAYGQSYVVPNSKITLRVRNPYGIVYKAKEITNSNGFVTFSPEVPPDAGRLELIVTAKSPEGAIKGIFYRQSGGEEGVFGVVIKKIYSGTVTFKSPTGQFATFSEPVVNGAFAAPALESIRGTIEAEFSGEKKTARQTFNKDAAPFSLVLTAKIK